MNECTETCLVDNSYRCCFFCEKQSTCEFACAADTACNCEYTKGKNDDQGNAETEALPLMEELKKILLEKSTLESKEKKLREKLKAKMESASAKAFKSNPYMKVTYVEATTQTTFDKKGLEKKYPNIYQEFVGTSSKSAYIKIDVVKGGSHDS